MKKYPSIDRFSTSKHKGLHILAFNKIDGSNIRAEWSKKKGFYKFGSRKQLIDSTQQILSNAEHLIREKYEQKLAHKFNDKQIERAVCFFELYGENSFAGLHCDEVHDVVILDIAVYKRGYLSTHDFTVLCHDLDTPALLYDGILDDEFIRLVKEKKLQGMTQEGVVCRQIDKNVHDAFKLKSDEWIRLVKSKFPNADHLL